MRRQFSLASICRIGLVFACGLVVAACASGSTGPAPVGTGTNTESGSLHPALAKPEATTRAAAHPNVTSQRRHRRQMEAATKPKAKPENRVAEKHPPSRDTSPDVIPLD
jgi:hypothetical protein